MSGDQRFFLKSCKEGDMGIVMRHLTKYVNDGQLEFQDDYGLTALGWSCWNGHTDVASELIRNGANVNSRDNENQTPLFNACYSGLYEICAILITNGADINAADIDGESPFAAAAQRGHIRIVKLLMDSGCNPLTVDTSGISPLESAKRGTASKSLVALIEKYVIEYAISNNISISITDGMRTRNTLELSGKWFAKTHGDLMQEVALSWKVPVAALSIGDETGRYDDCDQPEMSQLLARMVINVWPSTIVAAQKKVPKCSSSIVERRTSLKGGLPPSRSTTALSSVTIRSVDSIQETTGLFYNGSVDTKSMRSASDYSAHLPPQQGVGSHSRSTTATSMDSEIAAVVRLRAAQRATTVRPHGVIANSNSGSCLKTNSQRSVSVVASQSDQHPSKNQSLNKNIPSSTSTTVSVRSHSMTSASTTFQQSQTVETKRKSIASMSQHSLSNTSMTVTAPNGTLRMGSRSQSITSATVLPASVTRSVSNTSSVVLPEGLPAPACANSVITKTGIAGGKRVMSFPGPASMRSTTASSRQMSRSTSRSVSVQITPNKSQQQQQQQQPVRPVRTPQSKQSDDDSDNETEASPEMTATRVSYLSTLQQIRGKVLFGRKYVTDDQSDSESDESEEEPDKQEESQEGEQQQERQEQQQQQLPQIDIRPSSNITTVKETEQVPSKEVISHPTSPSSASSLKTDIVSEPQQTTAEEASSVDEQQTNDNISNSTQNGESNSIRSTSSVSESIETAVSENGVEVDIKCLATQVSNTKTNKTTHNMTFDERKARFEELTGTEFPEPMDEETGESVSLPADETAVGGCRQAELYGPATILHESAANGEVHVMDYLLSTQQKILRDTDLNAQDELGRTPLMYACITGKLKAAQLLVSKGCSVSIRDSEGHTAIFHATKGGHNDIIQWFSDSVKGVDFHALDNEGHGLTQWACFKGYLSTLRFLFEVRGVRLDLPDYNDRLCIHWASKQGSADTIKYLIQKGCAISLNDRFNKSAEDYAMESQHWGAVATIREAKLQMASGQQSSQWKSDISRALSVSNGVTMPSGLARFSSVATTRLG